MVKRFTRYYEFLNQFNIDLKKYSQDKVQNGNKGDYYRLLVELRDMLTNNKVVTKKPIEELIKKVGINASAPGLCQVLTGLGIITKVDKSHYTFNVNRIDGKLASFLFEYNHFKQRCLNDDKIESDFKDMFLVQFGKFEESITGINTFQTRKKYSPELEDDFEEENEPSVSMDFSNTILQLKIGKRMQRSGWNGKGMYIQLVSSNDWIFYRSMLIKEEPINLLPWIGMKTADSGFVPWLASQTDILAEDWQVLD